jgi:hypothetical protein
VEKDKSPKPVDIGGGLGVLEENQPPPPPPGLVKNGEGQESLIRERPRRTRGPGRRGISPQDEYPKVFTKQDAFGLEDDKPDEYAQFYDAFEKHEERKEKKRRTGYGKEQEYPRVKPKGKD